MAMSNAIFTLAADAQSTFEQRQERDESSNGSDDDRPQVRAETIYI